MSNLLAATRAREAAVENVRITIDGELASSPGRFVAIAMNVTADHNDRELLEKLVIMSERCLHRGQHVEGWNRAIRISRLIRSVSRFPGNRP